MPHITESTAKKAMSGVGTKRKREQAQENLGTAKKRTSKVSTQDDIQSEVLLLESAILASRKNYNNISTLLEHAQEYDSSDQRDVCAAVALCRVFCRLLVLGKLTKSGSLSESEDMVIRWLQERLQVYEACLTKMLQSRDPTRQRTAVTLVMRTMKERANNMSGNDGSVWRNSLFADLLRCLATTVHVDPAREEFVTKYIEEYDDVRYHSFGRLADILGAEDAKIHLPNILGLLSAISAPEESQNEPETFFLTPPVKKKDEIRSMAAHKKQAQRAWMAVLRQDLDKAQRKTVLDLMTRQITPWFQKVEILMDFLTDSYNVGGSTSLMALSGLFFLIQQKNLDYPLFYNKLYSLLDANILHSKHRSRFFRLLDTFLASTHLPAALVASFIKRLSRLSLHAPPSGIVVVVPWIYNLLKSHPACTFMIHRVRQTHVGARERWGDPFKMEEADPMATDAIESSLWEIHTLQSHYHPNVASIAKIISEQFTKQSYNIEDFLDHSYATMLDAELDKDIKKPPEVEYEIPKRIFLPHDPGSGKEDSLLVQLWDFS